MRRRHFRRAKWRSVVVWEGPSLFTGDPIVLILTGLWRDSANKKTGEMAQAWVLLQNVAPMDGKRQNIDDAVCGDCKLRGHDGVDSACYVTPWQAALNVWTAYKGGIIPRGTRADVRACVSDVKIRVTAYGDPAAVPFDCWQNMLTSAAGWIGYTHQWMKPETDPRMRWLLMASVDAPWEAEEAARLGWRHYRARTEEEPLLPGEIVCPASDEFGNRVDCNRCQLCRGRSRPAKNIAIYVHGKPGQTAIFYRNREAANVAARKAGVGVRTGARRTLKQALAREREQHARLHPGGLHDGREGSLRPRRAVAGDVVRPSR